MEQIILGVLTLLSALGVAWVTARTVRRKAPEDRESIVVTTTAELTALLREEIDRLAAKVSEKNAVIEDLRRRMGLLEAEVVRLGGDPRRINGGALSG